MERLATSVTAGCRNGVKDFLSLEVQELTTRSPTSPSGNLFHHLNFCQELARVSPATLVPPLLCSFAAILELVKLRFHLPAQYRPSKEQVVDDAGIKTEHTW